MIEVEPGAKTQAAISRCKAIRPKVKALNLAANVFQVSGRRGNHYMVELTFRDGLKLASCNCPAGAEGMLCYHVIAAIGVEGGIRRRWKSINRPEGQANSILVKPTCRNQS